MICLSDHQTISASAQFPMPKAIFIESAIYSRILVVQGAYIELLPPGVLKSCSLVKDYCCSNFQQTKKLTLSLQYFILPRFYCNTV